MAKFRTKYQEVADRTIASHPMRTFVWHGNRLFWRTHKGWLELVVSCTASWFRASEETTEILNKENPE